jgi:IclR family acetate operon transcriptional repressor
MDATVGLEKHQTTTAKRRGRPRSGKLPKNGGHVQSLTRALTMLERLAEEEAGALLTELAARVGLPPSTAHRLLKSMEHLRFVRQDEERGLWFIGVQAFAVGNAFLRGRDLVDLARPVMRRLMEDSGESVNLAVLDGDAAVYLTQIECREMMRALARPGGRAPIHCSGVGKALLAGLPGDEAEALIVGGRLRRYTPNTVTDAAELKTALARSRAQGFTFDDEEQLLGMRCVAAAIHDEYAYPVAAISLSGPTARITDDRVDGLGRMVARAAEEIAANMGGRKPG